MFVRLFVILAICFCTSQISFAGKEAGEDLAINLVNQRSEVKHWLSEFNGPNGTSPKTHGRPSWSIEEHKGNVYLVHVLEDMPDRLISFGFYDVNIKTKKVTKHIFTNAELKKAAKSASSPHKK
jgi:hypothetical protein